MTRPLSVWGGVKGQPLRRKKNIFKLYYLVCSCAFNQILYLSDSQHNVFFGQRTLMQEVKAASLNGLPIKNFFAASLSQCDKLPERSVHYVKNSQLSPLSQRKTKNYVQKKATQRISLPRTLPLGLSSMLGSCRPELTSI